MKLSGKISSFGGPDDSGMTHNEGLSIYEHQEADQRPDLFLARGSDPSEGTSKRLKTNAFFAAVRFDRGSRSRAEWQRTPVIITNPKNQKWVICSLVDWGPAERTGRIVDVSPIVLDLLGLSTDDEVEVQV